MILTESYNITRSLAQTKAHQELQELISSYVNKLWNFASITNDPLAKQKY